MEKKDRYIYLIESKEGFLDMLYKADINPKVIDFVKKERKTKYGINQFVIK